MKMSAAFSLLNIGKEVINNLITKMLRLCDEPLLERHYGITNDQHKE